MRFICALMVLSVLGVGLGGCRGACLTGDEPERRSEIVRRWADENIVSIRRGTGAGSAFPLGPWVMTASHVLDDDGGSDIFQEDESLRVVAWGAKPSELQTAADYPADWAVLSATGAIDAGPVRIDSPPVIRQGECVFVTGIRVVLSSTGHAGIVGPGVWPAKLVEIRSDGMILVQLSDHTPTTIDIGNGLEIVPIDEMVPAEGVSGGAVVRVVGDRVEPIAINKRNAWWTVSGNRHPAIAAVSLAHVAQTLDERAKEPSGTHD